MSVDSDRFLPYLAGMPRLTTRFTRAELAAIGSTTRRIREARGLTLDDVAAKADISASHLSRIENGLRQAHPAKYRRLAEALGVETAVIVPRYDLEGVA